MPSVTEEKVKKIILRVLRKQESDWKPGATFKDLEADSLDVVQILVAIEDEFGIEIQDEDIKTITDMEGFLSYIEKKVAEKAN
jgi:acyl carrier protein